MWLIKLKKLTMTTFKKKLKTALTIKTLVCIYIVWVGGYFLLLFLPPILVISVDNACLIFKKKKVGKKKKQPK